MKRILFMTAAMLLLVAGVTLAQTPTTSAPGPTLQREPGETSNNLPNPGNPQADPRTETGTPPTTATDETVDPNQNDPSAATDTTGTMGTTDTTTGTTGTTDSLGTTDATAQDSDVTGSDTTTDNRRDTTPTTTGVGATDTTDTTDTDTTDTTTAGMSDDANLPDTGSELPLLGLAGLLALGAAAGLRQINS